jgi:hypothetical protein
VFPAHVDMLKEQVGMRRPAGAGIIDANAEDLGAIERLARDPDGIHE